MILNAAEHRQWEAAVATWPTCQTCGGSKTWRVPDVDYVAFYDCPDCEDSAGRPQGRVPQPVYIVIEGDEANLESFLKDGAHTVVPARWRVPVGEPCEIRAECPACNGTEVDRRSRRVIANPHNHCRSCANGSVLLASAATVEVLPVFDDEELLGTPGVWIDSDGTAWLSAEYQDSITLDLDPLPVPGRHFVAVVTP
jgi:hypothetical protein